MVTMKTFSFSLIFRMRYFLKPVTLETGECCEPPVSPTPSLWVQALIDSKGATSLEARSEIKGLFTSK